MTENTVTSELKKSVLAGIWFMVLTFPLVVARVNTIDHTVEWRWMDMAWVGGGAFVLSFVWRWALRRRETGGFLGYSVRHRFSIKRLRLTEIWIIPRL